MSKTKEKRSFSTPMLDANSAFLPADSNDVHTVRVGFILQQHFSMMAFTAAVDSLVTANLVRNAPLFEYATYGVEHSTVISDLGIHISTSSSLERAARDISEKMDILIVCGGYRCALSESPTVTAVLKGVARNNSVVGSLWNGAIALAHAGLLENRRCALHPDNHALMRETFPQVTVSEQVLEVEENRATSAGPASALEMMLILIDGIHGKNTVRAIREILSCDQLAEFKSTELTQHCDDLSFPESLKDLLDIMAANIEEPLTVDELAASAAISRRRIERLFQTHLNTSPSRYYLELRITHARRLLLQGNDSIANIAIASGFVSSTHFSHCFKDFFGLSPTQARQQQVG